jgi:hypothetical protein
MGLSPAEQGTDATDYSWAFETSQAAVKQPEAASALKQPQIAVALKVAS